MTIKECIDYIDSTKPNQYTLEDKVNWLTFVDMTIINDVLKTHEGYDGRYDLFNGYTADKLDVALVVVSPYDRLYTAYLAMQIDRLNGETPKYNNSASLYNTYLLEYKRYYNKTHMPLAVGGKAWQKPSGKPTVGISDAEFEKLKRDIYAMLSDDVAEVISDDKLYDIVVTYAYNNIEMLKGRDGKTPVRGVDYFTENDINQIVSEVMKVENESLSKAYADIDKLSELVAVQGEKTDSAVSIANEAGLNVAYHEQNEYNPHKVTAEQVGAYSKAEADQKEKDLSERLEGVLTWFQDGILILEKKVVELEDKVADIDVALDNILAVQNGLIVGTDIEIGDGVKY